MRLFLFDIGIRGKQQFIRTDLSRFALDDTPCEFFFIIYRSSSRNFDDAILNIDRL